MDDDTFKAKPKKQIIDETEYEKNKMAQEECPVQCIEIEEYTEE
jgi:ferredoxin